MKRLTRLPVLVMLTALFGCSESDTNNQFQTLQPPVLVESIAPQLDESRKTLELIGPDGGSVIMEDANGLLYTLDVPPGVLYEEMEISMTPVVDIPDLHFQDKFLVGVQFGPEDIYFAEPLILTLELPADTNIANLVAFGWRGSGDAVFLEPIALPNHQMSFPISHFSGAGISEGNASDAVEQIVEDGTLEAYYVARAAEAADGIAKAICGFDAKCVAEEGYEEQFAQQFLPLAVGIFSEWLNAVDAIQIDNGSESDSGQTSQVLLMMREYYAWYARAFGFLCGPKSGGCSDFSDNFDDRSAHVRDNTADKLFAEFDRIADGCNEAGVFKLLYQDVIFALVDVSQGLGEQFGSKLAVEAEGSQIERAIKDRYACNLSIQVTGFPDSLNKNGPEADITVQLSNSADTSDVSVAETVVSFSIPSSTLERSTCGEIDGTSSDKGQTRVTNSQGSIPSIRIGAGNCFDTSEKVVLQISVDDQVQVIKDEYLFFGNEVVLEADVTDECSESPPQESSKYAQAVSRSAVAADCTETDKIVFVRNDDIFTVNPDRTGLQQLTNSADIRDRFPVWSPDRSRIAFRRQSSEPPGIYAINADGSDVSLLYQSSSSDIDHLTVARWSPDGSEIAVWQRDGAMSSIVISDLTGTGGGNRTLALPPGILVFRDEFDWSQTTGQFVVVGLEADGSRQLIVMNEDASDAVTVPLDAVDAFGGPRWSPDGQRILLSALVNSLPEILVIDADGQNPQVVPLEDWANAPARNPAWSADGTKIVFTTRRSNGVHDTTVGDRLYTMNLDGTELTEVTDASGPPNYESDYEADW